MHQHGTETPTYIQIAAQSHSWIFKMVLPLAIIGVALIMAALLAGRESKIRNRSQKVLTVFARSAAVVSIVLLGISGMAFSLGGRDQLTETAAYKRALDQFGLLEVIENRIETLRQSRDLKMVTVKDVFELSDPETRMRVSSILKLLKETDNEEIKRRLLSSLVLFRNHPSVNEHSAKAVPEQASDVGAPKFSSQEEAFDWIASQKGKNGWEPLPLFRFVRN